MTSVEDNLAVQQQSLKNIHSLGPSHSNSGKLAQGNKKKNRCKDVHLSMIYSGQKLHYKDYG